MSEFLTVTDSQKPPVVDFAGNHRQYAKRMKNENKNKNFVKKIDKKLTSCIFVGGIL